MNQNKLAQKRFRKALKRKNKKYTGPKYSKLDQLYQWVPLLTKAGVLPEPEEGMFRTLKPTENFRMSQPMSESEVLPARQSMRILSKDGKESSTSFTE